MANPPYDIPIPQFTEKIVDGMTYFGDDEFHFKGGEFHREGAPAVIQFSGPYVVHRWFINGQLHRDDGPAYEMTKDGILFKRKYYLNGDLITEENRNQFSPLQLVRLGLI